MGSNAHSYALLPDLSPPSLNDTCVDYPEKTVHALFSEQVARTPDAVALVYKDVQVTYLELDAQSNRLAHHLIARGVGEDMVVGVWLERSIDMITALLAILKAGGAYLPLDVSYPAERVAHMLTDARATIVISQRKFAYSLPTSGAEVVILDGSTSPYAGHGDETPAPRGHADNLVYINYTSGSTGSPKGVAIPHRAVARLLFGADYVRLDATRVLLQLAPAFFDAATFEIWGALLHGGRCVLFPDKLPTLHKLHAALETNHVTTLFLTTALFNTIIDENAQILAGVEQLLTGGEAHSVPHMRKALRELPGTEIISVYGPTETTTFATYHPVRDVAPDASSIPIGRPIANTHVYVLDGHRQPVSVGVVGELYIGGPGLARGYLNQPVMTCERFVTNLPFLAAGERLYRTGDLARYHLDGTVDFVGRVDNQVKIHGFRIELGEIETVLRMHPSVRQATVVVHERSYSQKRLVAYLIASEGPVESKHLRAHLGQTLPAYMVPAQFEWLDGFPMTPTGKVDRKALTQLGCD
jgi:amino acid adenylation domain-containing protein